MTTPATIILLAAAAQTTGTGTGDSKAVGADRSIARLVVDVSALTLGASVKVTAETARTLSGGFTPLGNIERTALGAQELVLSGVQNILRAKWEVTGTVTFDAVATVEQCYCTPADIAAYSLPPVSLAKLTAAEQSLACLAATDEAVSYLAANFDMPLTAWGNALRMHTANMAAYHAMKRRGMNPDADASIRLGYTDAIAWLKGPARADPTITDTTPDVGGVAVYVYSQVPRGWRQ